MASGMADDLVTTSVLSSKAPVLVAPAMHANMWSHPATQGNVRKLKSYGYRFVGPERGELSQGDSGWGRFSEVSSIVDAVQKILK